MIDTRVSQGLFKGLQSAGIKFLLGDLVGKVRQD